MEQETSSTCCQNRIGRQSRRGHKANLIGQDSERGGAESLSIGVGGPPPVNRGEGPSHQSPPRWCILLRRRITSRNDSRQGSQSVSNNDVAASIGIGKDSRSLISTQSHLNWSAVLSPASSSAPLWMRSANLAHCGSSPSRLIFIPNSPPSATPNTPPNAPPNAPNPIPLPTCVPSETAFSPPPTEPPTAEPPTFEITLTDSSTGPLYMCIAINWLRFATAGLRRCPTPPPTAPPAAPMAPPTTAPINGPRLSPPLEQSQTPTQLPHIRRSRTWRQQQLLR
jgi:hypothetical protein